MGWRAVAKCQCKDACAFTAAEGEPFHLTHDPRPERAEARREAMAERGRNGQKAKAASRAAASEVVASKLSIRTPEGQLQTLDTLLRNLMRSKLDAAKVAAAGGQLVKIAREVIAADELQAENRDLRALIAERMPELKKHLKAIP
jgi:hypothetical protein